MSLSFASLARSGAWSVVAQATQMLGAIALSIVVVRALTPEDFGVLSLARQITALVVIASGFAMERVTLRFVPEYLHASRLDAARRFLLASLALRLLGWAVWFLVIWALAPSINSWLDVDFTQELLVGTATAAVFSIFNQLRASATARFATGAVALASAAGAILTLLSTVFALHQGHGIVGVLMAAGIGMGAATLLLLPSAWGTGETRRGGEGSVEVADERQRIVQYALAFTGIAVLNHLVHSQTEIYFLARFVGKAAAGHFQLGFLFAQRIIDFLPLALWEVSMAGFSHLTVSEPWKVPEALKSYLVLLYLVLAPIAMFGIAFTGAAFRILYGDDMLPGAMVARAYFVIGAIAAGNAPIGMIIYAREKTGQALRAYALFAMVNLALDLALIPRFELWGAVLGIGIAKLLNVLLFARIAWAELPELRVPWRFISLCFLASSPPLLYWPLEGRFDAPLEVVVALLVAALATLAAFRLLRVVGPQERALIERAKLPLANSLLRLLGA